MRAALSALLCLVTFAAQLPAQAPCSLPETLPTPKPFKTDIPYETTDTVHTSMELFLPDLPKGAAKPPLVMLVHGGSWRLEASKTTELLTAAYFLNAGFAVANIRYRLVNQTTFANQFPAAMQDVRCAVRVLRANAAGYNYNSAKVGAIGGSAGGNLVAMLSVLPAHALPKDTFDDTPACLVNTTQQSSAIDAVAEYYPVVSVAGQEKTLGYQLIEQYTGKTDANLAMPQYYVEHYKFPITPTIIINGLNDKLIKPDQARGYTAALKARGAEVQHFEIPGLSHGFIPFQIKQYPELKESNCAMFALFNKHLR